MFNNIHDFTSQSYDSIKYILNSEIRLNILLELTQKPLNVEDLQKILKKQETNILRSLRELEELNLIEKNNNKKYSLTSSGYLACRNLEVFIENWMVSDKFNKYWNTHALNSTPIQFSRYLYLWKDAKLINADSINYAKTLEIFKEKISNQKNLKIILPIFSKYHIEAIINSLENNDGYLKLITSKNIYDKILESEFSDKFKKLRENDQIKTYITDDDIHQIFYTIVDDCALLTLFYNDGIYDDSSILVDEKKENALIHKIIFDDYEKTCKKTKRTTINIDNNFYKKNKIIILFIFL